MIVGLDAYNQAVYRLKHGNGEEDNVGTLERNLLQR